MAVTLLTPLNSFVRFDGELPENHCIWGQQNECLPAYADDDIAFQFIAQTETVEEANALCTVYSSGIEIGLISDCLQEDFDVVFLEQPERYRIGDKQVLFAWPHGLPNMTATYEPGDCFRIRVILDDQEYCSNCFQRIPNDCFTSVVEYSNEDNFAGFNYCSAADAVDPTEISCEPTIITFVNKSTLTIPYTASMIAAYGDVPTVQVWIYDGAGQLLNMGITAKFDAFPVTQLLFDFGGNASGLIVVR